MTTGLARRRNLSTPPEDDDLWATAEAVAALLGQSLSRLVAKALRDYDPIRVYLTQHPAAAIPNGFGAAAFFAGDLCPSCGQIAGCLTEPDPCPDPFHRSGSAPV